MKPMTKASIPVIKFLFKEDHKVLGEALSLNPGFDVEEFADSNELSSYLSTVPAGLVVTSLKDRDDLVQIATFMKIGKKIAKDTAIKVVVFNAPAETVKAMINSTTVTARRIPATVQSFLIFALSGGITFTEAVSCE